ncbi:M24 family metallopeptidase [Candidatus Gracilibacteria bacterium]|nr:M24 family metallopeptidase [Candidatus Gracilibacteria bacterium]NUJ98750.1 M24 family metallopeptidase [Candidatus Gracilibacteria bacterium]
MLTINQSPFFIYTDTDKNGYTNKFFYYLLGFQPTLGYILFDKKFFFVILDARYFKKLNKRKKEFIQKRIGLKWDIHFIELKKDISTYIKDIVGNNTLYIENSMSLEFFEQLKEKGIDLQIGKDFFKEKRLIKNEYEIDNIEKAIKIIKKVWKQIERLNKKGELFGKTELWLRGFIIRKIIEFGGEGESFPSIVAFGKNSATPHHNSGKTKIGIGPLLVDMGAIYRGYMSDFTRTLWVNHYSLSSTKKGKIYKDFKMIQKIVKGAHDSCLDILISGIKCSDIDKKVRDYIIISGYGKYFTHSTGHGVGLDIHESPTISQKNDKILEKGMTCTIEPGIYIPGYFGLRYENLYLIK